MTISPINSFTNEALCDFTVASNRTLFKQKLVEVHQKIQAQTLLATPLIDGKELRTPNSIKSLDPSDAETVVGVIYLASQSEADLALNSLQHGASAWQTTDFRRRAEIIGNLAKLMQSQRMLLASIIVREAAKPWREADADVCEAIDFCNYYAQEMLRLGPPQRTMEVLGEDNIYFYQPRGLAVVIAPWNFPLAIACGMTVAALVSGNCTLLKPAEQTSIIAMEFAKLILKAGIPPNAFAFLPGYGEEVGRYLVSDPRVDIICFTGSKAVGLEILRSSSNIQRGQQGVKRVIAEMGGKNAIIVDEDADLDEAIKGILASAFGYSGQKCSACSRVIAVGDAYEPLMTRLADAAKDLIIGAAQDSATFIGPVIDLEAQARIFNLISRAEESNKPIFKGNIPSKGFFVAPTIFKDVSTSDPLWREEIFGPVVTCRAAADFDQALTLANDSEYALTGGVYSRSPGNIEKARLQFKVGNLYINRSITGALVCRHPFGGFKMSGVGSKAGGPDYLLQFMEPRAICENTMRRGFAPELRS